MFKSKTNAAIWISSVYCVGVIMQNILVAKNISFFGLSITGGDFISPLVFIAADIQTEVFGFRSARKLIFRGYFINLIVMLFIYLTQIAPGMDFYTGQQAFETVFSNAPRILLASFTAYLVGSLSNAKVMSALKKRTNGKGSLFARCISSTIVGQTIDNTLFILIGFAGRMTWPDMLWFIVSITVFETLYEVLFFPLTRAITRRVAAAAEDE